jgi:hypothetical protein
MLDITYIYALIDPINKNNFHIYIGKSDNPYLRYYQHLREKGSTYKIKWIQSLLKINLLPDLQILEQCNIENWEEKEKSWIKFYKNIKWNITNETDGGDGIGQLNKGKHLSLEHKIKLCGHIPWNKGLHYKTHPCSEETKKKIGQANKGKYRSDKIKEQLSKSHIGKLSNTKGKKFGPLSLERRKQISNFMIGNSWNIGKHRTEKEKLHLSLIHKGKKKSLETRKKMSEAKLLNKIKGITNV